MMANGNFLAQDVICLLVIELGIQLLQDFLLKYITVMKSTISIRLEGLQLRSDISIDVPLAQMNDKQEF